MVHLPEALCTTAKSIDRGPLWVDAVEKGLRTPANSDSPDSMDWAVEAGDDGSAE